MDHATAGILNELTRSFYERCAQSFSDTRSGPWKGWLRCLAAVDDRLARDDVRVLDLGCGNLRFEAFLAGHARSRIDIWAVDSCEALVSAGEDIIRHNAQNIIHLHILYLDIASSILNGDLAERLASVLTCDIACAFGLMHHIPGIEARLALIDAMLDVLDQDGYALVSLWQLTRDARLAAKAQVTTEHALAAYPSLALESGDCLLGWKDEADVLRYCHDFDDAEIDAMIEHVKPRARLVDRFNADGKSGDLNCYLILQRHGT